MKKLLLPLLILTVTFLKAQQFGGNPPLLKWKQVNTPAVRIIFPAGLDATALQVAAIVKAVNGAVRPTIGQKQQQVSIVLQNQTTISNAYVGLAPFRSEFYLTPDQNSFELGSLPWPGQLAIHEFRHVQQYNNFNTGLSHVLKVLFGEGGQALGNTIAIPDWFFEGDAVYNETHVSAQGRGRLPFFFNGYRALWAAGKNYSWMKLRNGSYRDYTPDHYPLGYMLVAYGREKYGDYFWKDVTHDAASFKGVFYPLQGAVKKYSGDGYIPFRNKALSYFKEEFKVAVPDTAIKKNQHFTADQQYPAYMNDSAPVYLKNTYDHIPQFVVKTGNTERSVAVKSITTDNYFSYNNNKIIYAAYGTDRRWSYRSYNELVVLNMNTGREQRITHKTRYFSPAFSDDGKSIVAVHINASGKCALHILNPDGKLIAAIANTGDLFYTYPQFYKSNIIAAVRNPEGKMSLAVTDPATGKSRYLIPFSYEPAGYLKIKGDTVYFTKTNGLNDDLFALSLINNALFKINTPSLAYGAGHYQAAIGAGKIAWTSFTAFGYRLNQANRDGLAFEAVNSSAPQQLPDMGIGSLGKGRGTDLLSSVVTQPLPVSGYSKAHGLFNFHSLIPNINDPNYSLALAGENVLNTFQSRLILNYNRNEGYKRVGYEAVYGALFPYIAAGADYTFDRRSIYKGNNIYYNETDLHAGLEVPLDFSAGKHLTRLNFGSDVYYSQNAFQQVYRSLFAGRNYTYLNNYLNFSNRQQQARKNINPHFAQSISLNYKTAVAGSGASQFIGTGTFYFPGLFVNHSLVISGAYQQKGKNNGIGFSNDFPFSRGYTSESLDHTAKAAASYHFPVAYPDAGFGNLYYLLRLRGNFFYEDTYAAANNFYINGGRFQQHFRTAGAALFFDGKLFNEGAVSFGIRYSYLLNRDFFGGKGSNRIELVLPVSIF